ncbi:putative transposase [Nocardiopsis sp. Huas11]|uniref:IS607 family element RNA-guided endonuclease TnpB n=1 Tax=Nocardiopsis sp. Huas11 TaxID=2183912 RepID=UPI000EB5749E|nr:IS607 family element RNA-guided endonuclease TnpB [Nocardiopsis sp. Huas11]RKS08761.1 putative transposase [Nocardiopsis sp. Huas11]
MAAAEKKPKKKRGFEPRPGRVVQAYTFALDPNAGTEARLRSHCGAARVAFNWNLACIKANLVQRDAERSYGIAEQELTPALDWSAYSLRKAWNAAKEEVAPWWGECSKEAFATGCANLATALANWKASKSGVRKGPRVGFPRFKSKRRTVLSCRFTTGTLRVEDDRRHLTLPRLGTIRTHENTRKLHRRLANGSARILSATVSYRRGRWRVAFQVEVKRETDAQARPEAVAGVDLGIKTLAVVADDSGRTRQVPNPHHLKKELGRLRRASRKVSRRRGPDRRTGQVPSNRWCRADAERKRVHHRVANLREGALHKLTTSLAREYGTIVVEDLNVAGMVKNRRLARSIADASFGQIRRQLDYKTVWNGGRLVVADRWFASSKTCSACGALKAKMPLHVRVFDCDECDLVLDRDVNAARNLAALAAACRTGTGVAGDRDTPVSKPRGADRKTRTTRRGRKATAGRAGGTRPAPRGKEARDRRRDTQLTLW